MRNFTGLVLIIALTGCAQSGQDYCVRYQDDPELAGVRVQQYPDCDGEAAAYRGRHPAMIIYVFKDGRANQVGFEPGGTIDEDFWFTLEPDDILWKTITPPSRHQLR